MDVRSSMMVCVCPYFPCKTSSSNTHGICRSREQAPRNGGISELRKCVTRCEETVIKLPGGGRETQAVLDGLKELT